MTTTQAFISLLVWIALLLALNMLAQAAIDRGKSKRSVRHSRTVLNAQNSNEISLKKR